jgi:hypothetical protein
MVKILTADGREEKFDSRNVEVDLVRVGLPDRVAREVAERLEERVQDGWTVDELKQETDVELRRLEEDIDRAHNAYKSAVPMGNHNVGEQRSSDESDSESNERPRTESKVECKNVE